MPAYIIVYQETMSNVVVNILFCAEKFLIFTRRFSKIFRRRIAASFLEFENFEKARCLSFAIKVVCSKIDVI